VKSASRSLSCEVGKKVFGILRKFARGSRLNFYSTSYNTDETFAILLVMMALTMGINALMVLPEHDALRWRAEMATTIQPY
jgi:hypothetical protein